MEKKIKAELILENGMRFKGYAFGYIKETVGEVVFTTAMTGYQETITDPSFAGQIVTMTYPLIGNYGINLEDMESKKPYLKGFIVREKCNIPNNWRCEMELEGFLKQHKIMGLEGIDTRALTRTLRDSGTMRGIITTRVDDLTESQIQQKFNTFSNENAVKETTCEQSYVIEGEGKHVAVVDCGVKNSVLQELSKKGCKLTVFPAYTSAEEILKINPDAVFFSNGPGNPIDVPEIVETAKTVIASGKPVMGICLGHQIVSLALGCTTESLKFGHHGGNHPVKDLSTGKVYITSQNNEYAVTNIPDDVEITFKNVNDGCVEGLKHKTKPVYTVQFYPSGYGVQVVMDRFMNMIEEANKNA